MTDAEFDELWRELKERDESELYDFLNRWNNMKMIEKENYVIQYEKEIEPCPFQEDQTDDEGGGKYYAGQKEYFAEYDNILRKLKSENRI